MNYITIEGELVTPKTEAMAYEQTNHRVDTLEQSIQNDFENVRQEITETANEIENSIGNEMEMLNDRIASGISSVEGRIDNIIAQSGDDISEITDARLSSFDNTSKGSLFSRLNYDFNTVNLKANDLYGSFREIRQTAYIDDYNLFDKTYSQLEPSVNQNYQNGWIHGYYDYGSGLNPYEGRYTTYFIPVDGGKTVYTKINDPQECRTVQFIHAYDINKNRLVSSSPWVSELSLPIDTRFIKITTNQLSTVNNEYFTVSYKSADGRPYRPYGQPYYSFPDESARQMAVQNCSDISDLKTAINTSDSDILPDYWKTYLDTKIGVLREKLFSLGNHGVSFMFFTDYHLTENQRHTKAIMKYIANKTKISKIIFGGDILGTHTINEAKNLLWDFVTKDSIDGQINLLGNHDINLYGGTDNMLTLSETYSIYGKEVENNSNTNQNFYFFQDNESQKIRYIYLNTEGKADGTSFKFNEDTAQVQWFCDTLASTPDNYKILVFCHLFFNPNADTSASLTVTSGSYFIVRLMEVYNARQNGTYYNCTWDFRNSQAECMTLICGHVHRDYSVNSSGNIRIISTVCDANSASANAYNDLERTTGTYKEQAIDIFFVDTENNTIETIRIGAGEDRSFSLSSYQQDTP